METLEAYLWGVTSGAPGVYSRYGSTIYGVHRVRVLRP